MRTVFVAGIGNSERDHWQSIWARTSPGAIWVQQKDWDNALCQEWTAALETVLRDAPGPKVVVAHSLGCLVVAAVAQACAQLGVVGAFLVSVPDVNGPKFPRSAAGFPAAISTAIPLPSMVVASTDDPYGSLDHAERAAAHWKSEFVNVGARGHINLASHLGEWHEGMALFRRFTSSLTTANPS